MNRQDMVNRASALLEFERRVVGVKLVYSKEEFDRYEARTLDKPMSYCVAVKSAMCGHALKLTKETSKCPGSTDALGLDVPSDVYLDGRQGVEWLGLYETCEIAATRTVLNCESKTYGVIIKPLEQFETDPDVVLMIGKPRMAMRLLQGYSYKYGVCSEINMAGNQAVCIEGTVIPLLKKHINVSLLCSGTRFNAGWKEEELLVGIPYEQFEATLEGVLRTVNPTEMDPRKVQIEAALSALGDDSLRIEYGKTYYWRADERWKGVTKSGSCLQELG